MQGRGVPTALGGQGSICGIALEGGAPTITEAMGYAFTNRLAGFASDGGDGSAAGGSGTGCNATPRGVAVAAEWHPPTTKWRCPGGGGKLVPKPEQPYWGRSSVDPQHSTTAH